MMWKYPFGWVLLRLWDQSTCQALIQWLCQQCYLQMLYEYLWFSFCNFFSTFLALCVFSAGFLVGSESKHSVSGVTTSSNGGQGCLPVESPAVDLNVPVESSAVDLNKSPAADMVWVLILFWHYPFLCIFVGFLYPLFSMQYIAGENLMLVLLVLFGETHVSSFTCKSMVNFRQKTTDLMQQKA